MSQVHNGGNSPFRMPLIIDPNNVDRWLDPDLPDQEIKTLFSEISIRANGSLRSFKSHVVAPQYDGPANHREIS